ncbi:hypothetical protein JTB14_018800 [Gonioctena quinquepunctata]|nr:hypothetical protein JTB14_018800 [Gonioctena quinquepunctata]
MAIIFADDLALVVSAQDGDDLVHTINEGINMVARWATAQGLELASSKTKATILKAPRKREGITFTCSQELIEPKKHLKYLGITLSTKGGFGQHTNVITTALRRMMPNIGSPKSERKKVLHGVVFTTLPDGTKSLKVESHKKMMTRADRKRLTRMAPTGQFPPANCM